MSPPPPRVSPVKENLNKARKKLLEAAKSQALENMQDTLPEIARPNQTEAVYSGSKEPALFQRRPNKPSNVQDVFSLSPSKEKDHSSLPKRNYTRVLVSPEPVTELRLESSENTLYQRRSPRKYESGSHHKKEKKKEKRRSASKGSQSDLNITLQVPEDCLGKLNTEDIFDRIINCDNADVDIDTLRDLRAQILGELKQTGTMEDISDLILKSYRNKKKKKKKASKKKQEIEEGELSNSESEAIESIYGSLVIVDGEEGKSETNKKATTKAADADTRKIQIRLIISNTDKNQESSDSHGDKNVDEFPKSADKVDSAEPNVHLEEVVPKLQGCSLQNQRTILSPEIKTAESSPANSSVKKKEKTSVDLISNKESISETLLSETVPKDNTESPNKGVITASPLKENKANFYNPIAEPEVEKTEKSPKETVVPAPIDSNNKDSEPPIDPEDYLKLTCDSSDEFKDEDLDELPKETQIPFLSEQSIEPKPPKEPENVVSQIDILQALKNEILGESLSLPVAETVTPALHQPKVTKVSNVKEIAVKKTISLEKYKQKSSQNPKPPKNKTGLFNTKHNEDLSQKPSRGLTAKECERFNFSSIVLDDLSDEEDAKLTNADVQDIYADLAPQSPDVEIVSDAGNESPVIIPADPVKASVAASSNTDVDMRNAGLPTHSPQNVNSPSPSVGSRGQHLEQNNRPNESLNRPSDPRKRKDMFNPSLARDHSNSPVFNPAGTPRQNFPNMTPNMTPNARLLTPSHPHFDQDQSSRKHVYAPSLWDINDREQSGTKDRTKDVRGGYHLTDGRSPRWEEQNTRSNSVMRDDMSDHSNRDRYQRRPRMDPRLNDRRDDGYSRADCPPTPSHYFGRGDYPGTPNHPFGRSECPLTPSHPFGRSDGVPTTPKHPFGSGDCPPTPSHPFGMSDVPRTPSHPFGRSEYPVTPSHPFGRSECPTTPIHPFGRSGGFSQDPRCKRNYDEDDRSQTRDYNSYDKYGRQYSGSSEHRFGRDHGGRNDVNRRYSNDQRYAREPSVGRSRAPSVGRSGRDFERDRPYNEEFSAGRHAANNSFDNRPPRERSVGRMVEQHHRSNSRAPSVGRTFSTDPKENTVSVESHAGRSFTIDTSVNATFQEFNFNDLNWNRSFDARRQRAASVGRSLNSESSLSTLLSRDGATRLQIREGSVGRCLHREGSVGRSLNREGSVGRAFAKSNDDKFHSHRRTAFKRAQSVGRDLGPLTNYDHRARFESFKAMAIETLKNKQEKSVDKHIREAPKVYHKEPPKPLMPTNPRDPRSRKDSHDYQKNRQLTKNKKDAHSPRKNCRDPRNKNSKPNKYNDQRHDKRRADSYGIVYTNDNIARGNILGPGYGVKNYKIPKIKRPVEEVIQKVEPLPKVDEKKEKRTEQTKESVKKKTSEKNNVEKKTSEKNNVEKKTAGNSKTTQEAKTSKEPEKSEPKLIVDSEPQPQRKNRRRQRRKETSPPKLSEDSSPVRTRRSKRAVIYDSESDNNTGNTSDVSDVKTKDNKVPAPRASSPAKGKEVDDELQFSFDIQDEDLDLFSGNLGSDNVIDNINDIIAELDKDIDVKAGDSITQIAKDNTLANILESLENADNTDLLTESHAEAQSSEAASLDSSTPSIKVITETTQPLGPQNTEKTLVVSEESTVVTEKEKSVTTPVLTVKDIEISDVVSTSITEDDNIENVMTIPETNERHSEVCSTPDSTINTDELSEQAKAPSEKVPDGTNETQSEMNSDISSTHDNSEKSKENIAESNSSKMGSLGSILSLLQDKTKIKELLSMLDDQTDNEKIKKKLEKLSEIVSDDEETEDKTVTEIDEKDNTLVDVDKEKERKEVTNDKDKEEGDKAVIPQSKDFDVHEQTQHFDSELVDSKLDKAEPEAENISKTDNTSKTDSSEGEKDDSISKADNTSKSNSTSAESKDLNTSKPDNTSKDENLSTEEESDNEPIVNKTKRVRKTAQKRGKGKLKKSEEKVKKRVTRSSFGAQNPTATVAKKPNPLQGKKKSTELQKLQEDIRDMFISNDVLKATGIRMCRLAKITEQKNKNVSEESSPTKTNESSTRSDADERSVTPSPVVVLEKISKVVEPPAKPPRKKPGPKPKGLNLVKESEKVEPTKSTLKSKPGPKSKTRPQEVKDVDPYDFETDSINELTKGSENNSSDTDDESLTSSQSLDSTDLLVEMKSKPKRKRCNWNKGVIKSRKTKKKDAKKVEVVPQIDRPSSSASESQVPEPIPAPPIDIPDWNCFTDKSYCFSKSDKAYTCRLCGSAHEAIVHHYKKQHPHYEIPLSRMNPLTAKEAIKQSMITNFQQISKVPVAKYVCRFCFLVFDDRRKNILESFFWHVVSSHTGEYKQLCAECTTVKKCTFMLDIPPPPQDKNGLLMGYICGKCNYTQVSLENLKNHVSLRHNDEETEVYTISLGAMTQKLVESLKSQVAAEEEPRTLRSLRSKPAVNYEESMHEPEAEEQPARRPRSVQSKIRFEGDAESIIDDTLVKSENEDEGDNTTHLDDNISDNNDDSTLPLEEPVVAPEIATDTHSEPRPELATPQKSSDVFIQHHFMISFTETGNKEYLCCINGDNHYKTTLLISMKKHVQIKHAKEPWDGYCSVCNVIVMPQGVHNFTELLAHVLDTHTGNFPVLENTAKVTPIAETEKAVSIERKVESPRPYINVRPLTDLITPRESETSEEDNPIPLPKIQSVISLNTEAASTPPPELSTEIDSYQEPTAAPKEIVEYKYEEVQKEIMDNKHQIVLDSMMAQEKLTHIFKCAGRYCSFTCNEAESALVHASTHHRIGGLDAFRCTYCSFDASGNSIDLVSHVFKEHGSCKFCCKLCFYRAFSSPLVESHYGRVHGALAPGVILQSTGPSNVTGAEVEGLLSRQEAVRHYSCCFGKGK